MTREELKVLNDKVDGYEKAIIAAKEFSGASFTDDIKAEIVKHFENKINEILKASRPKRAKRTKKQPTQGTPNAENKTA